MLKLSFTSAFLCIVTVIATRTTNAASIIPSSFEVSIRNASATPGVFALGGFTDCGVARLADIRFQGCSNAPCRVTPGTQYTLELDFAPRDFHCCMEHKAILLKDITIFNLSSGPLQFDGNLQPGQVYTFTYRFSAPSSMNGDSELRLMAFQNYVHEICIIVPTNIG